MYRITLSRADFQEAIEAGIAAATGLPDKYVARLRKLGREAKTVSGNYSGCPITRVGAYRPKAREDRSEPGAHLFVNAYDDVLWRIKDVGTQYHAHRGEVVTNKHGEEIIFIKD